MVRRAGNETTYILASRSEALTAEIGFAFISLICAAYFIAVPDAYLALVGAAVCAFLFVICLPTQLSVTLCDDGAVRIQKLTGVSHYPAFEVFKVRVTRDPDGDMTTVKLSGKKRKVRIVFQSAKPGDYGLERLVDGLRELHPSAQVERLDGDSPDLIQIIRSWIKR